jgi:flap endonuclease-1
MGIKHLNSYLKRTCKTAITPITLWDIRGKTVVIDASIYMYRFAAQDMLIEGMYQLTMLLHDHRIRPLYVFDGTPPPEKDEVLQRRRLERANAYAKYEEMRAQNKTKQMEMYKRQSTRLKRSEIDEVKRLLTNCGATWYQATGEADILCAYLMKINEAWACMSDDMDMFVYGCARVIRGVNIYKKTAMMYDLSDILTALQMSFDTFKRICILSGTDYYKGAGLYSILMKCTSTPEESTTLLETANVTPFEVPDGLGYEKQFANHVNELELRKLLSRHGFVFCK